VTLSEPNSQSTRGQTLALAILRRLRDVAGDLTMAIAYRVELLERGRRA
jgi:hypothetical protein